MDEGCKVAIVVGIVFGGPFLIFLIYQIYIALTYVRVYRVIEKEFQGQTYKEVVPSLYQINKNHKNILFTEHSWGDSYTRKLNENECEIIMEYIHKEDGKYFIEGDKDK